MYILGFETTGPIGSVAIIDLSKCSPTGEPLCDDAIVMKTTDEPMSHLKNTAKLAHELLEEIRVNDDADSEAESASGGRAAHGSNYLAAVAASIGPGSFTGIRIGVTEARAISQALDVPAIAVPTLEVFKEHSFSEDYWVERRASAEYPGDQIKDKPIIASILNARRGQVYGAVYGPEGEIIMVPGPYMLTDVLEVTDKYQRTMFYGDGVDAYMEKLTEGASANKRFFAPEETRYQTADLVVKIAARKYVSGETLAAEELLPDYMRLAEAEQKLNDGTLAKLREAKLARMKHK